MGVCSTKLVTDGIHGNGTSTGMIELMTGQVGTTGIKGSSIGATKHVLHLFQLEIEWKSVPTQSVNGQTSGLIEHASNGLNGLHIPHAQVLIKVLGILEHVTHVGDFLCIPLRQGCIKVVDVLKESVHVGDLADIPMLNGSVDHADGLHVVRIVGSPKSHGFMNGLICQSHIGCLY